MTQFFPPFILFVCSLALFYASWRLSKMGAWFLSWIRGSVVVAITIAALILPLLAYELTRFDKAGDRSSVVKLSIAATDQQNYLAEFTFENGAQWYTTLEGDAWQLEATGISYRGLLGALGAKPAYRLSAITTRYYDYARRAESRRVAVLPSAIDGLLKPMSMNSWSLLGKIDPLLSVLGMRLQERSARVVPLVDGAAYRLRWSTNHLDVSAANETGQRSLKSE